MEEKLHKLRTWIGHGSLRQFYTEVAPKLITQGYQIKLVGNVLTCYSESKEGGFLGIGARKTVKTLLKAVVEPDDIKIAEEDVDPEFLDVVLSLLKQH
jgi:hypothetical protein